MRAYTLYFFLKYSRKYSPSYKNIDDRNMFSSYASAAGLDCFVNKPCYLKLFDIAKAVDRYYFYYSNLSKFFPALVIGETVSQNCYSLVYRIVLLSTVFIYV